MLFGCDFSMIAKMFKDRTRVQIKNKFHREERYNPTRVEDALNLRKRKKIRLFSSHLGGLKAIANHEHEQGTNASANDTALTQIDTENDFIHQSVRKTSFNSIVSVDSLDMVN